jgi:hypothetical protein
MSKRSSSANWHITQIVKGMFRRLHKPTITSSSSSRRSKKIGTSVMNQQYVKFVYKGNFYRRPIIPRKQLQQQQDPPKLLKIPAQPLGVPKAFKEPVATANKTQQQQHEMAALVANKSSQQQQQQQKWSWKSWFSLNTPLLILNFGSMATLLGFTRSDVLELRSLAMTGNCTFVIYSLLSPPPIKWPAIMWSMLFASVNGYNITKILRERQGKVILTPHETEIYMEHFQPYGVTQFQFHKVITQGHTKLIEPGTIIAKQGSTINSVKLVVKGKTRAHVGGRHLTAIGSSKGNRFRNVGGDSGAWIGEMAFLQCVWDRDHAKKESSVVAKVLPKSSSSSTSTAANATATLSSAGDIESSATTNDATADQIALQKKISEEQHPQRPEEQQPRRQQQQQLKSEINAATSNTTATTIKSGNAEEDANSTTTTIDDTEDNTIRFISTIVAVEPVEIIEWSFDEMYSVLKISNDMQNALTRSMTAAIVGKVVNFMVSRQENSKNANLGAVAITSLTSMLENWRGAIVSRPPLRFVGDLEVDDDDEEDEQEDDSDEDEEILATYANTNRSGRFRWV